MNRFYVYVVELTPLDPTRRPRRCDVYVGSSAFTPAVRLEHHLHHRRGSRHVKWRGVRLRPDLYAGQNPFSDRVSAMHAEHELADRLSAAGHHVYGACRRLDDASCIFS